MPEKILLGIVHVIRVHHRIARCPWHSELLALYEFDMRELHGARTTDDVEPHQAVVSHAQPHRATLQKVLDAVLLRV